MSRTRRASSKRATNLAEPYSDVEALNSLTARWPGDLSVRSVNPADNAVLVVDDDPEQLKFLKKLVERAGFRVITSESATDALGILSERKVDVIVSDYKMPEMNGFEFLQAVRHADSRHPSEDIPVIMLTACGDELEFVSLERGADMFCEKFRADSLLVKQIRFLLEM